MEIHTKRKLSSEILILFSQRLKKEIIKIISDRSISDVLAICARVFVIA